MPSEQAIWMSTSLRIASMPEATCASNRSSGPRTAATMQNSVAPDLAVCLAASTRLGMSSQALRTGEAKSPDCEQKWQSSGQPPVFRLMMPSTSTSGPHQRIRTSWASASSSSSRSSGSCSTVSTWSCVRPSPRSSTCSRASVRMSVKRLLLRKTRTPRPSRNSHTSAEPRIEHRSGYGSRVQLHKRDVVEAATAILDTYGIADLTMRRLGRELNVSPGALYWHFSNKQQLLGAIADRILEPVGDVPGDWRDRVAGTCGRLRDALLSHTDGAELVSASFAAGQSHAMTEVVARLSDAAGDAGVIGAHTELAARTVVYY